MSPLPRRRRRVRPPVSLVTGGASGIGFALAAALRERSRLVVIADLDGDAAAAAAARLGPSVASVRLDVTDADAVRRVYQDVAADHGSLDLVANNAGVGIGGLMEELTDEHWRRGLELNLGGVVNGVRAAYPIMRRQGRGVIVNTASLAGLMPVPAMLPYTTSKWAVVGLSLGLRAEAAPHGIQVSALCPSFVDTPLLDSILGGPSLGASPRETIRRVQPALLTADDTAAAALRGIDRDQAVIAVGAVAQAGWRATRVSPQLTAWLGARRRVGSPP